MILQCIVLKHQICIIKLSSPTIMEKTILSSELYEEMLHHFNEMYAKEDVKNKSLIKAKRTNIPVLFFGDLKKYQSNDFKLVTAALNPSPKEFTGDKKIEPKTRFSTKFRFDAYDGTLESLEKAYSNYFENKPSPYLGPYDWFKKGFKPVLNSIGYCFYQNKLEHKAVLHTDFCSPIATSKKWSKLGKNTKEELTKYGFVIWKKLIKELKPNLILISLAKEYLQLLEIEFLEEIYYKPENSTYKVELYKVNVDGFSTHLVWGSSLVHPFQAFTDPQKEEIGEIIKGLINSRLKNFD